MNNKFINFIIAAAFLVSYSCNSFNKKMNDCYMGNYDFILKGKHEICGGSGNYALGQPIKELVFLAPPSLLMVTGEDSMAIKSYPSKCWGNISYANRENIKIENYHGRLVLHESFHFYDSILVIYSASYIYDSILPLDSLSALLKPFVNCNYLNVATEKKGEVFFIERDSFEVKLGLYMTQNTSEFEITYNYKYNKERY